MERIPGAGSRAQGQQATPGTRTTSTHAHKGSRADGYPPERIAAIWDDLDALDALDGPPADWMDGTDGRRDGGGRMGV